MQTQIESAPELETEKAATLLKEGLTESQPFTLKRSRAAIPPNL